MASSVFILLLIVFTFIINNANSFSCDPMMIGDIGGLTKTAQNSSITAIEFDRNSTEGQLIFIGGFLQDITHLNHNGTGILPKLGIS